MVDDEEVEEEVDVAARGTQSASSAPTEDDVESAVWNRRSIDDGEASRWTEADEAVEESMMTCQAVGRC